MKKAVLVWTAMQVLIVGAAAASIIFPAMIKGKNAENGATTDPRVSCQLVLLSHGKVQCEVRLTGSLLDIDWVQLKLRDGTEHEILAAQVQGILGKDGKTCSYTFQIDRTAVRNSYVQIAKHETQENLWVLLESIGVYDDWTHKQNPSGWSQEQVLGTFGPADYDSRSSKGVDEDGSHVLSWRYGRDKDLSVRIRDDKVVDHWRGSR